MTKSFSNKLLAIAFIALLIIPWFGEQETKSLENRSLKEFPEWDWGFVWGFFSGYKAYYEDRFPFKNDLVQSNSVFKLKTFNTSPLPRLAEIGKEGWMYYNTEDYRRRISIPLTQEQLSTLHYNLHVTTEWFKKHNIDYYLTIPPVKAHLYPEYMPEYMQVIYKNSNLEILETYLSKSPYINNFITYTDELLEKKKQTQIYYKVDTHWNEKGGYIGYAKIIDRIRKDYPELDLLSFDQFEESREKREGGDLQSQFGLSNLYYLDYFEYKLKNGHHYTELESKNSGIAGSSYMKVRMDSVSNSLKLFMTRDSFTNSLFPFTSVTFNESVYSWTPKLAIGAISKERPDIIVHEILERFMHEYLELTPEIAHDTAFLARFDRVNY